MRIRKLRVEVGGETDTLNTLTAALEAKKVQIRSSIRRSCIRHYMQLCTA